MSPERVIRKKRKGPLGESLEVKIIIPEQDKPGVILGDDGKPVKLEINLENGQIETKKDK